MAIIARVVHAQAHCTAADYWFLFPVFHPTKNMLVGEMKLALVNWLSTTETETVSISALLDNFRVSFGRLYHVMEVELLQMGNNLLDGATIKQVWLYWF